MPVRLGLQENISAQLAPTPTHGLMLTTPAPSLELLARDNINAPWGYANGNAASPLALTCPDSYTETVVGVAGNFLGCCAQTVCVNDIRTCVAFLGGDSEVSEIYTSYTSCPQAQPSCVTYIRSASPSLTSYACGASATVIEVFKSPLSGAAASYAATSGPAATVSNTPSTSSPDSSQTTASSGYTEDQKIALGCGIGIGLPATIASLILLWMKCFKKR